MLGGVLTNVYVRKKFPNRRSVKVLDIGRHSPWVNVLKTAHGLEVSHLGASVDSLQFARSETKQIRTWHIQLLPSSQRKRESVKCAGVKACLRCIGRPLAPRTAPFHTTGSH